MSELTELAQALGRVEGVLSQMGTEQNQQRQLLSALDNKFDRLPCIQHSAEIKDLETWKKGCNTQDQNIKLAKVEGNISLKNAIWIVVVTNLGTLIITIIVDLITKVK